MTMTLYESIVSKRLGVFKPFATSLSILWAISYYIEYRQRARYNAPPKTHWALITGGSSGIGKELAIRFARQGRSLILCSRNKEKLEAAQQTILTQFPAVSVRVIPIDLSDDSSVPRLIARLQEWEVFDRIGWFVLNAGVGYNGFFEQSNPQRNQDLLSLNIRSAVGLTRQIVPTMIANRCGTIVFVSSVAGSAPSPNEAVYSASKAFLDHFATALRYEVFEHGIHVLLAKPGATITNFGNASNCDGILAMNLPRLPYQLGFGPQLPEEVAKAIDVGVRRQQSTVIPGVGNQLSCIAGQLLPSNICVRLTYLFWKEFDCFRS